MTTLIELNRDENTVTEIYPHVYHLDFRSHYDLAMHFLRFQEYYESPKFHRQVFTIIDYMEWYANDYASSHLTGAFTYPRDWVGFNVPSNCLLPFLENPEMIPDPNKYDHYMLNVIKIIKDREGDHPFYFIGTNGNCALEHELAHAFYTVDAEYRQKADQYLNELDQTTLNSARNLLMKNNYHQSTVDDEIQAHSATGLMWLDATISKKQADPFVKLFEEKMKELHQNT